MIEECDAAAAGTWLAVVANMRPEELRERTMRFAVAIVRFCEELPAQPAARRIAGQLQDSGTSVASNYRAACRARSRAEFVAKIGIVVEEVDEAAGWLELLVRSNIVAAVAAQELRREADELTAIFVASQRTAKSRR